MKTIRREFRGAAFPLPNVRRLVTMFRRLSRPLVGLLAVSLFGWMAGDVSGDEQSAVNPEALSGNGWHIAFSSQQNIVPPPPPSLSFDPRMQLYLMDGDGSRQTQITDFFGVKLGVRCSPDGLQIAFHAGLVPFASNPARPTIFLMDADGFVGPDGTGATELVSGGLFPAWSPGGTKIAYQTPPPLRDVMVLDLTTGTTTNLTNDPNTTADDAFDDYRPDWSPDGHQIVFTSNRSGHPEIWVMNSDGSDPHQLTFSNGMSSNEAHFSPNGQQIVFASNRDYPEYPNLETQPGSEIYVMNADGSDPTRLTFNLARDGDPHWAPDGHQIVWDSDRDVALTFQLYLMNADGSDEHAITGPPGENSHPGPCRGHLR